MVETPAAAPAPAPEPEPDVDDEIDASLPPQLRAVVNNKIQAEVRKMAAQMEAAFQEREARLLGKIASLESRPQSSVKPSKK